MTYVVGEHPKGELLTLNAKNELVSRVGTMGDDPCHISINRDSTLLTITNYESGSVAIFMLENKIPVKIRCFIAHEGHSTDPDRQTGSHPHSSVFS